MHFQILHLSDIHANFKEETYLNAVASGLCADINLLQKEFGLSPDLICITGDLINKGENASSEFPLVEKLFLTPLAEVTKIDRSAFYIIPGNHEIDQKQLSESFERGLSNQLTSEETLRNFIANAVPKHPDFDLLQRKLQSFIDFQKLAKHPFEAFTSYYYNLYVTRIRGVKIGIAAINSAWRSSQYGPDDGRLLVGEQTILAAAKKLESCDIRICLCHHPFEMLSEWDAKAVTRKIAKHFHILLNGHVHDSYALKGYSLYGNYFTSTVGSLRPHEPFASYTYIDVNLDADTITCYFRKWHGEREAFDRDTSKCQDGICILPGVNKLSSGVDAANCVAEFRHSLQLGAPTQNVVCPIDGIEDVRLRNVFVTPVLYDSPGIERDTDTRQTLDLLELIQSHKNLVIYGRSEYGKTTVLRYIQDELLSNEQLYGSVIPLYLNFTEVSPKNPEQIFRALCRSLEGSTEKKLKELAVEGRLTLLIDDYHDRDEPLRNDKSQVIKRFFTTYPKCRYVLTTTEHLAQNLRMELFSIAHDFNAKPCHIGSLNTARLRQLITKWGEYKACDVEGMLKQLLYYFRHFQIPVTPLAATLFVGVLFRKKKEHNIRNEAYLIENYFETLLEKLSPSPYADELEFKDKEDFLAYIAWEMVKRDSFEWSINDYERAKIDYFDSFDEELPHHRFFDAFIQKGILTRDQGRIRFRRRPWFHFFLAKALEKSPTDQATLLARPDVLRFSKALAYKAGLVRNDADLLEWIDSRALGECDAIINQFKKLELSGASMNAPIQEISTEIAADLKQKNAAEEVDKRRDNIYLTYDDEAEAQVKEEDVDNVGNLITLQSDVIRNTTKINVSIKRRFLQNNVRCYVALMWGTLEVFKEIFKQTDEEALIKMFFRGRKDAAMTQKLSYIIDVSKRIVQHVVPLSILVYMTDHLGNPKMQRSYKKVASEVTSPTERLFFSILLFSQDQSAGFSLLRSLVTKDSTPTEDFVIYGFLRCFCNENQVTANVLTRIIDLMDWIRIKYIKREDNSNLPYLKDDFRSSLKKRFLAKKGTPKRR